MNEAIPPKPIGDSPFWFFMRRVWDYVFGGKFPLKGVRGIRVESVNGQYEISKEDSPQVTSSSTGLRTYVVKSKIGDVLTCRAWNPVDETEGETDIEIAVNFESRQLDSETINSVTYTYAEYGDVGDGINDTRVSNNGTDEETQIVTPMWYVGCIISAIRINGTGVLFDDTINEPYDLKLVEVSARCWAKVAEEVTD